MPTAAMTTPIPSWHGSWLWAARLATSILDTPASVSVITQAEIERRDARTLEDVLQYSAGTIADYYGTDDRNDYYQIRASTPRPIATESRLVACGASAKSPWLTSVGGHPWCQLDPVRASRSGRLNQLRDQATARGTVLRGVRHSRIDSRKNTGSTSATC